ncbi:transposase family protein [Myxococcota bacterium]
MSIEDKDKEIVFLRDQNEKLQMQVSILQKTASKHARSPRYTLKERLHALWFMEFYQIPRLRWGLWPIHVLVAIDHFSRKVVRVAPLEGPNAGWVCDALEVAFRTFGPPRHLISDHEAVFTGAAMTELLKH